MSITLREAARELTRLAMDLRDVAGRLEGPAVESWAAARDVRAIAANIDHRAAQAERVGIAAGEPDPEDVSWIAAAAPGELMELYGK